MKKIQKKNSEKKQKKNNIFHSFAEPSWVVVEGKMRKVLRFFKRPLRTFSLVLTFQNHKKTIESDVNAVSHLHRGDSNARKSSAHLY